MFAFLKKEILAYVFSCEFCKIFKNTFFAEHLWITPSGTFDIKFESCVESNIKNRSRCDLLHLKKISVAVNNSFWCNSLNISFRDIAFNWIMTALPLNTVNPFVPNAPFLYPLKTSESLTVFWCFQGVGKGCIGNKCVKDKAKAALVNVKDSLVKMFS